MFALQIRRPDGSNELRELSKTQPLSIGRQSFNDVCIPEEGVGAMHCRVSWQKVGYEATAATPEGIDVNGSIVTRAILRDGDVIRIGSLDFLFIGTTPVLEKSSTPPLPPIPSKPSPEQAFSEKAVSDSTRRRSEPASKPLHDVEELSMYSGVIQTESQALAAVTDDDDDDSLEPHPLESDSSRRRTESAAAKPAPRPVGSLMRATRPGEEEILKSPLVLGLTLGAVVLLLVSGIFWFLMSREQTQRLYDRAFAEMNDGQYQQSISTFEDFGKKYPNHKLRRHAERGLGQARVRKEIGGGTPAWKRGLEELRKLAVDNQKDSDFSELIPILAKLSGDISLGAAKTAEATRDPELLIVSDDARVLLERYSDTASPPTSQLAGIKQARELAERAIGKQSTFDGAMALFDAALADQKPMAALYEREKLVRRFPDYADTKRVREALQKALDLEKSVVVTDETERSAQTDDRPAPTVEPVLGLFHARARSDEPSQGRTVYVLAKDCCYAVDTVTGESVWRRPIGSQSPFFPVTTAGTQAGLLLFDSRVGELIHCQPQTGKLIWRQRLDGRPRSAPLIVEGQIYLPTDDNSLVRVDLESGRLTAKVRFSQQIVGPPTLAADGAHLIVVGEMAMIYSLSLRPLAAVATTFTGHADRSVSAPPLMMGKLLLVCENDKVDSARLRVWDAAKPKAPLAELASQRVTGAVRDVPILRGNTLVVPSSGEHLAAFAISDEAGRAGMAPIAQYRVKDGYGGATFVTLGSDYQFWTASSAFRRFEIDGNAIRMDANSTTPGIATQPIQASGEFFFTGRRSPGNSAIQFSAVERERLTTPWRIILGATPLVLSGKGGSLIGITEAGNILSLGQSRLKQGGVDHKAASEIELPGDVRHPVRALVLPDGRLAMVVTGDVTQVWIVNEGGQVEFTNKLPSTEPLQADPVLWDEGLVLPIRNALKLFPVASGKKPVQDWKAPAGEKETPEWRHLARVDGKELIAVDTTGLVRRVQLRAGDIPHLAEVTKLQLEHPVETPLVVRGEAVYLADTAGTVRQLNSKSFDLDGLRTLKAPVHGLWPVGDQLLAWSGDALHSLGSGKDLPLKWSLPLKGLVPAGDPVVIGSRAWIGCRDGTVVAFDLSDGKELERQTLPQRLSLGMRLVGEDLFAVAMDGALYRIETKGGNP